MLQWWGLISTHKEIQVLMYRNPFFYNEKGYFNFFIQTVETECYVWDNVAELLYAEKQLFPTWLNMRKQKW